MMFSSCFRNLVHRVPNRSISYLSDSSDTMLSQLHAWNINQSTYLEMMNKHKIKSDMRKKDEKDVEYIREQELEYLTSMALKHAINN